MGLFIFLNVVLAVMLLCAICGFVDAALEKSKVDMVWTFLLLLLVIFLSVELNAAFLDFHPL